MDIVDILKVVPFTITMLFVLVAVGVYGRTHVGRLADHVTDQVGFSLKLFFRGQIHRAFTSLFFTAGGAGFYGSLTMFTMAVGWAEFTQGSRTAALTFFGVHLATLLVMALLIATPRLIATTHRGTLLWDVKDVGPSAGYYGCLGLALAGSPLDTCPMVRGLVVAGVFTVLTGRLLWSGYHLPEEGRVLSADIAHVIAFPFGLLASVWS